MNPIVAGLQVIAQPLVSILATRSKRKQAKAALTAKAEMAKQSDSTNITLTDAEWEVVNAGKADSTWKDEFVTVIILYPFVGIFLGSTYQAFTGDPRLMQGTLEGIKALQTLGVDIGYLMIAVVLAAVGLKMWRSA